MSRKMRYEETNSSSLIIPCYCKARVRNRRPNSFSHILYPLILQLQNIKPDVQIFKF